MKENPEVIKIDFDCTACKKQNDASSKIPVSRVIEKLDLCFKKNDLKSAEELLEYWQREALSLGDTRGELSIVNEMLGLYRKTSDKVKGEKAIERSLKLLRITKNEDTVSGATIILNAATTCKAFGRTAQGIELYEKTNEIYKNNLSEDDILFSAFYNNYATALVDVGDYATALNFYNKAIEITSRDLKSQLDCAITYVNLAHLYEKSEGLQSENIENCLSRAELIFNDERMEKNSYYAFVCEKCAPSFDYFGFFMTALRLQKEAREIYERA